MSEFLARRLSAERRQLLEQIGALQETYDDIVAAADLVATDDEHDPEGSTIAFERSRVEAMLDFERGRLADVDAALARLETPGFGRCESCGEPIGDERLAARPATRTCISCAAGGPRRRRTG